MAFLLGGCGSNGTPETSTIHFKSPAVGADGVIRADYECGAGTLWLPTKWGPIPPQTEELAVYIGRFKYKKVDGEKKLVVPFADLISHIKPSVRHIAANTFPPGISWSALGSNSCPTARLGQNILMELFAFDQSTSSRELNSRVATRLTEEALSGSDAESRVPGRLTQDAAGRGQFIATYGPS